MADLGPLLLLEGFALRAVEHVQLTPPDRQHSLRYFVISTSNHTIAWRHRYLATQSCGNTGTLPDKPMPTENKRETKHGSRG